MSRKWIECGKSGVGVVETKLLATCRRREPRLNFPLKRKGEAVNPVTAGVLEAEGVVEV